MSQLRILFIDDDEGSIRFARKWADESNFQSSFASFNDIPKALDQYLPHIAVVDRIEGDPPVEEVKGEMVFDQIWNHRFCPIIMYTAFPDTSGDQRQKHPFVKQVKKGADLKDFQDAVGALVPHANALEDAERHVRQQFALALREVAPYAVETFGASKNTDEAIVRHGRRRLAALMDEMSLGVLASWEHYVYPPVNTSLLLGDILQLKDGSAGDPKAFRIVLTPSCDLAAHASRKPKVKEILVANCCDVKTAIQSTPLCREKGELPKALEVSVLSQGFYQRLIPLPALKGKIPCMMVDLKRLELIPINEKGEIDGKFIRIASIDSPFRELISWAYMQTACRPGLPDRDFGAWSKEIMDAYGA